MPATSLKLVYSVAVSTLIKKDSRRHGVSACLFACGISGLELVIRLQKGLLRNDAYFDEKYVTMKQ